MISLQSLLQLSDFSAYKLHLACWNGEEHPLDVFVQDADAWDCWNTWRGKKDDFNREYILSFIDFYPQKDRWLFGGIYRVTGRKPENCSHSYELEKVDKFSPFVGRLKVQMKRPARGRSFRLENYIDQMSVTELLPELYTGEPFIGYENVSLKFSMLENLIRAQRIDWKTALSNVKGIYLVVNADTGKMYVGSAYGIGGFWSRWECYINTGHGFNDELTALIDSRGIGYAREHFSFSLLEQIPISSEDCIVIRRECHWKSVLMTRQFGYNKN